MMAKGSIWPWVLALGGGVTAWWIMAKRGVQAFGESIGLVRPGALKPAVGTANYVSHNYPAGWQQAVAGLDFVTAKILNGRSPSPAKEWEPVAEAARAAGIPFHGFGWAYARNASEAQAEGRYAGERCVSLGIPCYWVNAEADWLGIGTKNGVPRPAPVGHPVDNMHSFVAAFRAAAPNVALINNAMTSWMSYDLKGREEELVSMFDGYAPMIYSHGSRSVQAKKWRRGWELSQATGVPYCPMPGSGRIDNGEYWGFFKGDDGIAQLQREMPADWICFYMAPLAGERLFAANAVNPAITTFRTTLQA